MNACSTQYIPNAHLISSLSFWIEQYTHSNNSKEASINNGKDIPEQLLLQLPFLLLAIKSLGVTEQFAEDVVRIEGRLEDRRHRRVGVLGTSIDNYLVLSEALGEANEEPQIRSALLPFVSEYDEAVRLSRQNRYHWERLAIPFHPVEPDVIGVLRFASIKIPNLISWLEVLPLSPITMQLLTTALNQYGGTQVEYT